MNIKIKTIGFTAKPSLAEFVKKKIEKLARFYNGITGGEISLTREKSGTRENKLCQIRLIVPGYDLLAIAQCKSFEEAVDRSSHGLLRQIEKRKNRF